MTGTPRQRMLDSLGGHGEGVPVAYWQEPSLSPEFRRESGLERAAMLFASPVTRIEHPHCAFYRSPVARAGRSGTVTVLYTPEGRLTRETFPDAETGNPVIEKLFITKPAHYAVLLSYLKDACVTPDPRAYIRASRALGEEGLVFVSTLRSPIAQFIARFRDPEGLAADRLTQEEAIGQCIFHMKRLFRDQTAALLDVKETEIAALWVPDAIDAGVISPDDFHRYCLPRYRELHTAFPDAALAVQAGSRLRGYRDDPREIPARGCLAFPLDCDLTPEEALWAWPRRSLMIELPETLCRCPEKDIAQTVRDLCALPGARQRMALVMPPGIPAGLLAKSLRAALEGVGG